ncbi:unnamed protein product, partial [Rotaria socialis]
MMSNVKSKKNSHLPVEDVIPSKSKQKNHPKTAEQRDDDDDDCDDVMMKEVPVNETARQHSSIPQTIELNSTYHDHVDRDEEGASSKKTATLENDFIRIVCISDTHNGHSKLKFDSHIRKMQGDILIHAGDFSEQGTAKEVNDAVEWLSSLDNFKYKIFISGNMDGIGLDEKCNGGRKIQLEKLIPKDKNVIYLENEYIKVSGITIYGCPYTPKFYGGFQYARKSREAKNLWSAIPEDCDILVSHGPPLDILDESSR